MTSDTYVIDTSSLIELHRHQPRDVFPSVWARLEKLIREGRLIAPREVLEEIDHSDDQLSEWARGRQDLFCAESKGQIGFLQDIVERYPAITKDTGEHDADPWVIALALERMRSPQKTLSPVRATVVTEERIRGNQVRIPLVCREYGIDAIRIQDMFRNEGWRF